MITKLLNIPKQYRSKHYKGVSKDTPLLQNKENTSSSSASYTPPYHIDANGDLVLSQKKFWFDGEYVDESKIITWDEAVSKMHEHANKTWLDTIDQHLSTDSSPTFDCLNLTDSILAWGATFTGEAVIKDMTVSNRFSLRSQLGDAVYLNSIFGNAGKGLITNCDFAVAGDMTVTGKTKTKSLTVEGTLDCYELVANKVRSTNGLLYVTDSAAVKAMSGDKLVVEFAEYNLQVGDYLLMQSFTGASIKRKLIKLTYQSPIVGDENQFNYHVVADDGTLINPVNANSALLPDVGDYYVKIDSSDTERRSGIVLSPYDKGYIDFYEGAGDGINRKVTTSIGNLDHLNKPGVSGNGLFSDNAYLEGSVFFKTQKINTSEYVSSQDRRINLSVTQQMFFNMDADVNPTLILEPGKDGQIARIIVKAPARRILTIRADDGGVNNVGGYILVMGGNSTSSFLTPRQTDDRVYYIELYYAIDLRGSANIAGTNIFNSGWIISRFEEFKGPIFN